MDQQLQDNLKLVAEWLGWKESESPYRLGDNGEKQYTQLEGLHYHDDWSKQIPVWAKLCMEMDKLTDPFQKGDFVIDELNYNVAIRDDNPRAGFDIIVSIIKRIKK